MSSLLFPGPRKNSASRCTCTSRDSDHRWVHAHLVFRSPRQSPKHRALESVSSSAGYHSSAQHCVLYALLPNPPALPEPARSMAAQRMVIERLTRPPDPPTSGRSNEHHCLKPCTLLSLENAETHKHRFLQETRELPEKTCRGMCWKSD